MAIYEGIVEPGVAPPASKLGAGAIVSRYLTQVHRFAVMSSPTGTDPDDVAQQAILRALERIDTFDPRRGRLDAWLWRIVVNVARDAGRISRRRDVLFDRIARDWADRPGESAENIALDSIRDEKLVAAVRRLPTRYRTIIALRFGAGLDAVEVARLLGTTRMAVAKATRRALDRLRTDLANEVTP